MMNEILRELTDADAKDFTECLLENLRDLSPHTRYKMFLDLKYKEPAQWKILSKGCRAAAEIFISLMEYSRICE